MGKASRRKSFGPYTITSSGSYDVFVAKLDSNGNWQWAKQAGGSSVDYGRGISVDSSGNSYVTGYFQGTASFGPYTITSSGRWDVFVAKLDSNGNWQWAKQAGGSMSEIGFGISVDSSGNSYITGWFQGTASFGPYTITRSGGPVDVFVAKLDSNGNWQWAKQAGGSSADVGRGISVDSNGNSYVTGYFRETASFGPYTITSSGLYDVFVAKLDSNGNWQWAKQAGGSFDDYGVGVGVDSNGNSYITGYFKGMASFGITILTSSGYDGYDIFIAKLIQEPYILSIDIKPGSYPNSINPNSKGNVPVAVLTTDDFDTSTVNPDTIVFLDATPCKKEKFEDVDGDGDIDMLVHFKIQECDFDLLVDEGDDYPYAYLTGETIDGQSFMGKDTVKLVPPIPRNKTTNTPFLNFLTSHPSLFPILQRLLLRLGLQN